MTDAVDGLLCDKVRPSRIATLAAEIVAGVVAKTLDAPPGEMTHWTEAAMAKMAGINICSAQRVWQSSASAASHPAVQAVER